MCSTHLLPLMCDDEEDNPHAYIWMVRRAEVGV